MLEKYVYYKSSLYILYRESVSFFTSAEQNKYCTLLFFIQNQCPTCDIIVQVTLLIYMAD